MMPPMEHLRFSVPEILSLIGVVQCVYILVYILFRVANFKQSVLPVLYFFVLGCAFFIDFSREYIGGATPFYDIFAFYSQPHSHTKVLVRWLPNGKCWSWWHDPLSLEELSASLLLEYSYFPFPLFLSLSLYWSFSLSFSLSVVSLLFVHFFFWYFR